MFIILSLSLVLWTVHVFIRWRAASRQLHQEENKLFPSVEVEVYRRRAFDWGTVLIVSVSITLSSAYHAAEVYEVLPVWLRR